MMATLLFALLGAVAGVALDALAVRLTSKPAADEDIAVSAGSVWQRRLVMAGATAGLFALAASRYQDDASHAAVVAAYACVLLTCAVTDIRRFRVPNALTYPAIAAALVAGTAMPGADLRHVIAGGALAAGLLFAPALWSGGLAVGMGDVKLAAFAGLALGVQHVVAALVVMALAGGVVALALLLSGRRGRGDAIPYAPFISAGALASLYWQGAAFRGLL